MATAMRAQWGRLADQILPKIHEKLEAGDWAGAETLANQLTLKGVVASVRPKLEELAVSAVLFGAHRVTGDVKTTTIHKTKVVPPELHGALAQLEHSIEHDAADYVRKRLHAFIADLKRQDATAHMQKDDISTEQLDESGGLLQPEQAGKKKRKVKAEFDLSTALNDAVLNDVAVPIDLGAHLTTSRLITLGYLSQAQKSGQSRYRVDEVLDDKTCPVCQEMNGKIFSTGPQLARTMQALSTSDPADLKSIAPWPDLEDVQGGDPEDLQAQGYGAPPYHPYCYSEGTKVYTRRGFIDFRDVVLETDEFWSIDPVTRATSWVKAVASQVYDHKGDMYRVGTGGARPRCW